LMPPLALVHDSCRLPPFPAPVYRPCMPHTPGPATLTGVTGRFHAALGAASEPARGDVGRVAGDPEQDGHALEEQPGEDGCDRGTNQ
jgi:hypothetical protein